MKTILVPLDGSELAAQVMPYVRMLATRLDARLFFMHVVSEPEVQRLLDEGSGGECPLFGSAETPWERNERLFTLLRQQSECMLQQVVEPLLQAGLDVDMDVFFGSPADSIVSVATHKQADLIVMATHGYTGVQRWVLGSVTDKVVQATTTPVFVVRGNPDAPVNEEPPRIRRVLVPQDGSLLAQQALPVARMLATCCDADVHLFQAVVPIAAVTYPLEVVHLRELEQQDLLSEASAAARRALRTLAHALQERGLRVSTRLAVGYPAELIIKESEQQHTDVIVMATHGYGGLKRWALGSVADKVLHATDTPLVLVRAAVFEQAADTLVALTTEADRPPAYHTYERMN